MKISDEARDKLILSWQKKARSASKKKKARNLYVITLDPEVLWRREFRQANLSYIDGMPCVYVGMTIHVPGDRFQQHKLGYRSSKYPRKFGIELTLELMDGFDASVWPLAEREAALADWLRQQGIAVWQN